MMIHKIEPHKYYPEFRSQDPKPSDYLLLFDGEKVYLPSHTENSDVTDTSAGAGISEHPQVYLPTFEEVHGLLGIRQPMERFFLDCEYLFSIDDRAFFRKTTEDAGALMLPEEDLYASGVFRNFEPEYLAFAGITATQINRFRLDRKFCGRCGHPTIHSTTEGDPSITLQESELGEAKWFSREDVPDLPSTISVGQEMITLFKNGGDPFCKR